VLVAIMVDFTALVFYKGYWEKFRIVHKPPCLWTFFSL